MYLSDNEIRARIEELDFETYHKDYPFNDADQVQPSSIDLRLSDIFWIPLKKKTVDLRKSRLLEISPRILWRKKVLNRGEYISLKPGEILLGRVYEKFSMPKDCAGRIEGRSSFARLGLAIHCTGGFINPGYRGHMPIQMINMSPHIIKIFPFIPICQLILINLSSVPNKLYGEEELQHKYADDDGGPSYWWRDKKIISLQKTFREADISLEIQERIIEKIGIDDPEIIERMETFVSKTPAANLQNAGFLLDSFIIQEKKNKKIQTAIDVVIYTIFGGFLSTSIGIFFNTPFKVSHWIIWGLTALLLFPFLWTLFRPKRNFFTGNDIK